MFEYLVIVGLFVVVGIVVMGFMGGLLCIIMVVFVSEMVGGDVEIICGEVDIFSGMVWDNVIFSLINYVGNNDVLDN